jgi:murein DD-endopeptidase MepM/ murein hydrolase activator NlpD
LSHSRQNRRTARHSRALVPSGAKKALPQVYLKGGDKILPEIYMTDHGTHKGAMVKWILSTMFAGVFGVVAIGTVIYASMKSDKELGAGSLMTQLRELGTKAMTPFKPLLVNRQTGPRFIGTKSDRLMVTSKGLSARNIIHDTYAKKRDNREYLIIKPYALLTTSLATAIPEDRSNIPVFDPFKLYANTKPINSRKKGKATAPSSNATTKTFLLPLSITPDDDQYTLSDRKAAKLVTIAAEDYFAPPGHPMDQDGMKANSQISEGTVVNSAQSRKNTTIIAKSTVTQLPEQDNTEQHEKIVRQGDTMNNILRDAGAEKWQSTQIIAAMNKIYQARSLKIGQKIRYIAVPKPGDSGKTEPVEISLYSNDTHLVTVSRNEGGEYVASATPGKMKFHGRTNSYPRRATLYQSFYHAGLLQKLPTATIMKLLRIHAFDTDFKHATQPGDSFEAFFDMREDKEKFENVPNELLYTSITIDGRKRAFYRFRTPDGTIDYYDRRGNSAKKFLMRKPVRGNRVRLASGFGYRMHPILHVRKLHTGTDWAGPRGTPILAAGDGIVEMAGRKGGYGNHIRLRHANGYKTTYSHMKGYAKGIKAGIKVRQGQVIGYLGNTGRSTGPHLHFEVLVNNKFVNAMTIPVPRGLELKGHLHARFIKERDRIDELMSRDPITTQIASVK